MMYLMHGACFVSIACYELCSYFGFMYETSSSMKTYFGSMYESSSYYDRGFLIHEIVISWRFHDPYFSLIAFLVLCLVPKPVFPPMAKLWIWPISAVRIWQKFRTKNPTLPYLALFNTALFKKMNILFE